MAGLGVKSPDMVRQQDTKVTLRVSRALLARVEHVRRALEAAQPGMSYLPSSVLRAAIERGLRALEAELKTKLRR